MALPAAGAQVGRDGVADTAPKAAHGTAPSCVVGTVAMLWGLSPAGGEHALRSRPRIAPTICAVPSRAQWPCGRAWARRATFIRARRAPLGRGRC